MIEAALYILTGLTLYAGGHHLYMGINRTTADRQLQMGLLYLLLATFAFSSALTYGAPDPGSLLPTARLAMSLGILLWVSLIWHVAFLCGYKPLLLLDALTALWVVFLVRNLTSTNTLLYADVTPVQQTLLSGETVGLLFTRISPWWTAVELAMLASLLFCLYACYRLYSSGRPGLALANAAGLALLGLVTLFDHFVSVQLIQAGYLTAFGFLLFLLPGSFYPWLQQWQKRRAPEEPVPVYNLTYMPDQASFHTDVSQLHSPSPEQPAEKSSRETVSRESNQGTVTAGLEPAAGASGGPETKPPPDTGSGAIVGSTNDTKAARPASQLDTAALHTVSDNLIDIAVYATMALNRFKRGDADPQTLASLCKKVRSQAIKTRRLATQLIRPAQSDDTGRR